MTIAAGRTTSGAGSVMAPKCAKVFAAPLFRFGDFELLTVCAPHVGTTMRRRLANAVSAMARMLTTTATYGQVCVHSVASGLASALGMPSGAVGRDVGIELAIGFWLSADTRGSDAA